MDDLSVSIFVPLALRDVDVYVGPLSLYMEDAFVRSASELMRLVVPPPRVDAERMATAEAQALYKPLRINHLYVHPLDLTLTLHTAVRILNCHRQSFTVFLHHYLSEWEP